jgi:PAS domain S-box-containing protein
MAVANEQLQWSEHELHTLAANIPALLAYVGADERYRFVNRRFEEFWRQPAHKIVGKPVRELVGDAFYRIAHPHIVNVLSGRSVAYEAEFTFPHLGSRWMSATCIPNVNDAGEVAGFFTLEEDISDRKCAEQALHESEERLRAVVNTASDAIITIDRLGIIETFNPAAERMFGYAAQEAVGRDIGILMPSPYAEEHGGYIRRYLETGEARIIGIGRELIARHKDGRLFPIDLAVSQIDHLALFAGIVRDISVHKSLEEELLRIAGEEQQRIGQELHDVTGQELTALLLLADTLVEELEDDVRPDPHLAAKLRDGVKRTLAQVRGYSRGLMPVEVDAEGLQAALADLAVSIGDLHNVTCTFECPAPVAVTDNAAATHLYRIAQEAATNAIKHASPRHIWISLSEEPGGLTLKVLDDGHGISHVPVNRKGLGLRIMRHRANLIGARLSVGPAKERGTEVRVVARRT